MEGEVFREACDVDFGAAGPEDGALPRRLTEFAFARSFDRSRFCDVSAAALRFREHVAPHRCARAGHCGMQAELSPLYTDSRPVSAVRRGPLGARSTQRTRLGRRTSARARPTATQ